MDVFDFVHEVHIVFEETLIEVFLDLADLAFDVFSAFEEIEHVLRC